MVESEETTLLDERRFLDPDNTSDAREKVLLTSYPRSGNTYTRLTLERLTGIFTGSSWDAKPKDGWVNDLYEHGFLGEGVKDNRVWIVKTHFPERTADFRGPEEAQKVIHVVRNPFDVIDSYFNLIMAKKQDLSIDESEYPRFASIFDDHVREEVRVWKEYETFWTKIDMPVLFVKYEDLRANFDPLAKGILQFLLNSLDISGSEYTPRLESLVKTGVKQLYKPRVATKYKSLRHYSHDQLRLILTELHDFLLQYDFLTDELFAQPEMAPFKDEFYSLEIQEQAKARRGTFTAKWIEENNHKLLARLDKLRASGNELEFKPVGKGSDYLRSSTMEEYRVKYFAQGDAKIKQTA
mmetsp:Transcript_56941/g.64962  ORF Transcript_56941/g.64962 Transcript_56941/m.64962 type:complete len:353 (-) Transcript_56941:222-1280(-)